MTLNLLLSYAYAPRLQMERLAAMDLADMRVLYDSGAFTVWASGGTVELADYAAFLGDTPLPPWRYFTLDVIGDAAASRANYKKLRKMGLDPIPIVTTGSLPDADLKYYGKTADLIALGGLLSMSQRPERWISHCYAKKPKDAEIHLLGKTNASLIAQYRPYSVDSSSWDIAGRYGTAHLYLGGGKMHTLKRDDIPGSSNQLRKLIREHGVEPRDLLRGLAWRSGAQGGDEAAILSAASFIKYGDDVEARFGTKLFLAALGNRAPLVIEAYKRLEAA